MNSRWQDNGAHADPTARQLDPSSASLAAPAPGLAGEPTRAELEHLAGSGAPATPGAPGPSGRTKSDVGVGADARAGGPLTVSIHGPGVDVEVSVDHVDHLGAGASWIAQQIVGAASGSGPPIAREALPGPPPVAAAPPALGELARALAELSRDRGQLTSVCALLRDEDLRELADATVQEARRRFPIDLSPLTVEQFAALLVGLEQEKFYAWAEVMGAEIDRRAAVDQGDAAQVAASKAED